MWKGLLVITVTGRPGAVKAEHLTLLKDKVLLCNAGQFETELDLPALRESAESVKQILADIEQFTFKDNKSIYLVSRGNLVNLAAGDGNPIEVLDLGLAMQSLSLAHLVARRALTAWT